MRSRSPSLWRSIGPARADVIPSLAAAALLAGLPLASPGCAQRPGVNEQSVTTRLAETPRRRAGEPTPPAAINGGVVSWETLQPLLAEAAGAQVLEEVALDRALAAEARRRGIELAPAQVEAEESNLLRTLRESGAAADDLAGRQVIDGVRRQRGLGPRRYQALLRRTALLRAMVQDQIDLSEPALRRAYELLHGPRYRVRIITVDSAPAGEAARRRLESGEPFGEVAARLSTDPSASVGGLVEPISPADMSYPSALREALPRLEEGEVSDPIALDRGFAIVRLEEVVPADGTPFEEARASVEREARIAQERRLMNDLADRLLRQTSVAPLDESMGWSWRMRGR